MTEATTTVPARPAGVPEAAVWCPVRALWLERWTNPETPEGRWSAWTPAGQQLPLPPTRWPGVPSAATWDDELLLWKRRAAGKATGPSWWTWAGERRAHATVELLLATRASRLARPLTVPASARWSVPRTLWICEQTGLEWLASGEPNRQAVAAPEPATPPAERWAWCPVRKLHLRRETDQETGEERWLARTAGIVELTGSPERPSTVPSAATWDDRAKLWTLAGSPGTASGFWAWDGRELHPREVEALAPRPRGVWELSTAEARRTLAAAPKASPALVTQARIEVARVRALHEIAAAELRALEGRLGEVDEAVLSALLPLLRAGSLSIEAAIRRPADLPCAGS